MTRQEVERLMRKTALQVEPWNPGRPLDEVKAELGLAEVAQMATNENPHGPSPMAVAAVQEAAGQVNRYPHGACGPLRRKLAERLGVGEEMVMLANGGDECIRLVASAFLNRSDEVVLADPTFPVYEAWIKATGARGVFVPLREHVHDLPAMRKRIDRRTKLVIVCNPNNPTGTIVGKSELDEFVAALPAHVVLLLDEAYHEFVEAPEYPDGLEYVKAGRKVIVLRTFSKLYGLAGLRVGYTIADRELTAAVGRVRDPFPVGVLSQAAALAALDDAQFVSRVLEENRRSRRLLREGCAGLGLPCVDSHTNFILVDTGRDAAAVVKALLRRGYQVRPGTGYGLPTWLRVTFGTQEQNRGFITALEAALGEVPPNS